MKAVLICPDQPPGLAKLAEVGPIATLPILGESLLQYWLEYLAASGAREVRVLAADRPEQVRAHVGDGGRWGLRIEVLPESRELTVVEARAKYRQGATGNWLPDPDDIVLLDRLPGLPQHNLLSSYAEWFTGVLACLPAHYAEGSGKMNVVSAVSPRHPSGTGHQPSAPKPSTNSPLRVGMHEIQPGVWTGLHTHIAPTAQLRPPCWLGHNVWIGPEAVIGPGAVVEDRAFVEAGATITQSIVGAETYVGGLIALKDSLAWGSTLVDWRTGSSLHVADPLLLCALRRRNPPFKHGNWITRLGALGLMVATLPAGAWVMWHLALRGQPALRRKVAVCPASGPAPALDRYVDYYELASVNRWLRRWPQLWNVMRGEFTWVGNRPLSPADAATLRDEFERLWLAAPIGLISLADSVGCAYAFSDEARAHASYYAVRGGWRLDWSIFIRALMASLFGARPARAAEDLLMRFRPWLVKGDG